MAGRVAVVAAFLLCGWQDPAQLERLIATLASDSVEERERAEFHLMECGPKALPVLRLAAGRSEPEVKARLNAIIVECERQERELTHDSELKSQLLAIHRTASDLIKEKRKSSYFTGAARFDCSVVPYKNDLVLLTSPWNYMYVEGKWEDIPFEVVSVTDSEGRSPSLERCGTCSPRRILVKETKGPLRVRVRGMLRWYSLYVVEFRNPRQGDRKKVGDFVIEVDWPVLTVSAKKPWPKRVMTQMGTLFTYRFTENGRECSNPPVSSIIGRAQGGHLSRLSTPEGWCNCPAGPRPAPDIPKQDEIETLQVNTPGGGGQLQVDQVDQISYAFFKPIEEPIDFTIEVSRE